MAKITFFASLLWACFYALLGASALAVEKVKMTTPVQDHPVFVLPMLAAEEKGLFKQQGVNVEHTPVRGDKIAFRALVAKETLVGTTMSAGFIQAAAGGVPAVIVADNKLFYPFFIWVCADSALKTPKDLKGKRLGTFTMGGTSWAFGKLAMEALGLEKDVKIVGTGGTRESQAALKAGAVDAIVQSVFAMTPLKFKGEVRELVATREFLPREWTDMIVFAHREFLKSNPEGVKRIVKGFVNATNFIMDNPTWSLERMKADFGYSDEVARFIYPMLVYSRDGKISTGALRNVTDFVIKYEIIPKEKAPSVEEIYTDQFVK